MKPRSMEDERLRRAFSASDDGAGRGEGCPTDGEIWDAARGELSPERREALLSHSARCASCAESWRMAAGIGAEIDGEFRDASPRATAGRSTRKSGWIYLAGAAAAAVLVVMLFPFDRQGVDESIDNLRAVEVVAIESGLDEARPLKREECLLRWSGAPRGTLYTLEVSSENLTSLHRVEEIEEEAYLVPESALESLASGDTFLWRVEALHPDLTRVASPVFRAVLE